MTSLQKTSARYQQQRQRAIEAAATVFADKGFHGASTQDIASQLGIQQGSLYYYIDSKEAALEEVCLMALRGYVAQMENIIGQTL
ncbi:TetR/AcrR family transcriptional regulator, partial [Porticoccus sp.]